MQRNAGLDGCPVCAGTVSCELVAAPFPYLNVPMSPDAAARLAREFAPGRLQGELAARQCASCGHIYLATAPDEELLDRLYRDYYQHPSPLQGNFVPERDEHFLEYFRAKIKPQLAAPAAILEIGCYDGYVLMKLQSDGFVVAGCEPSDGAEIARQHGLDVRRECFNADTYRCAGAQFDLILARHLLEHMADPGGLIKDAVTIMSPGGRLIIEVPDSEFYLVRGLPEVFSHQHRQYFSAASLSALARRAGLRMLSCQSDRQNLIAVLAPGKDDDAVVTAADTVLTAARQFAAQLADNRCAINAFAAQVAGAGRKLAVWGAGGFGAALFSWYGLPESAVAFLVDSDPRKQGGAYPGRALTVADPETILSRADTDIIVASMYGEEISRRLARSGFAGAGMLLHPEVKIINFAGGARHD